MTEHRPRLSIELDQERFNALQSLIPWGLKNQLFITIIDDLIKILSMEEGHIFLALIISGKIKPSEALSSLKLAKEKAI